ncbi:hypothetical protein SAMN04487950_2463 [Halogranum rubrum]|uniref:Uncharacterized protein n=1 Tax=Halogranum rubrum TaxID=553466 RepID=A0A1I4EXB8_9EURY|nr:hypothetical protein [Halogranum rubrum]SFL10304.1 hypothetical protein SAMN04487950_2463 [Halogranum rubrum]
MPSESKKPTTAATLTVRERTDVEFSESVNEHDRTDAESEQYRTPQSREIRG